MKKTILLPLAALLLTMNAAAEATWLPTGATVGAKQPSGLNGTPHAFNDGILMVWDDEDPGLYAVEVLLDGNSSVQSWITPIPPAAPIPPAPPFNDSALRVFIQDLVSTQEAALNQDIVAAVKTILKAMPEEYDDEAVQAALTTLIKGHESKAGEQALQTGMGVFNAVLIVAVGVFLYWHGRKHEDGVALITLDSEAEE